MDFPDYFPSILPVQRRGRRCCFPTVRADGAANGSFKRCPPPGCYHGFFQRHNWWFDHQHMVIFHGKMGLEWDCTLPFVDNWENVPMYYLGGFCYLFHVWDCHRGGWLVVESESLDSPSCTGLEHHFPNFSNFSMAILGYILFSDNPKCFMSLSKHEVFTSNLVNVNTILFWKGW